MEKKDFVTKQGLFTSIIVTVIGVGIFSYPSEMAKYVGSDGWIITLLAGLISWALLFLFYLIIRKNNYNKFYDILRLNLGGILAKVFGLIFVIFNIFAVSVGMRIFSEVIKMVLLERTPTEFILVVLIITGIYLIRGEIRSLVRFNEVSFWIMFVPIILIFLLVLKDADFTNVLPVLTHEPVNYMYALIASVYSFSGYQIAYMLIPYSKYKKDTPKVILKSMVFITLFYAAITVMCLAVFNKNLTASLLWPTTYLIRTIDIPGTFIERWDGIAMALWVVFFFTTFTNCYYFSAEIVRDAFSLGSVRVSSFLLAPFIYTIALFPENIGRLYDITNRFVPVLFLICIVILPIILLITSSFKKRRCTNNEV